MESELTGIYVQDSKYSGLKVITIEKLNNRLHLMTMTPDIWQESPASFDSYFLENHQVKSWIKNQQLVKIDEINSLDVQELKPFKYPKV